MVTPAVAGGHPQALGDGIRRRILPVWKAFRDNYIKFDIINFKLPAFHLVVNKNFHPPPQETPHLCGEECRRHPLRRDVALQAGRMTAP
jgi:hypothetical protein